MDRNCALRYLKVLAPTFEAVLMVSACELRVTNPQQTSLPYLLPPADWRGGDARLPKAPVQSALYKDRRRAGMQPRAVRGRSSRVVRRFPIRSVEMSSSQASV